MRMPKAAIAAILALPLLVSGAAVAQDPAGDPARPVFALPPVTTFQALVDRPLFNPARKGGAEPAGQQPANISVGPTGSFRLIGIAGDGGRAVALLRDESSGEQFRLLAGDSVAGWRIVGIVDGSLELAAGGQTRRVPPGEALPAQP